MSQLYNLRRLSGSKKKHQVNHVTYCTPQFLFARQTYCITRYHSTIYRALVVCVIQDVIPLMQAEGICHLSRCASEISSASVSKFRQPPVHKQPPCISLAHLTLFTSASPRSRASERITSHAHAPWPPFPSSHLSLPFSFSPLLSMPTASTPPPNAGHG